MPSPYVIRRALHEGSVSGVPHLQSELLVLRELEPAAAGDDGSSSRAPQFVLEVSNLSSETLGLLGASGGENFVQNRDVFKEQSFTRVHVLLHVAERELRVVVISARVRDHPHQCLVSKLCWVKIGVH